MTNDIVLEVKNLKKYYPVAGKTDGEKNLLRAVDGVNLTVRKGEIVGLVGESGSGKSTVGKCITRLVEPTEGTITLLGEDITHLSRNHMRKFRRDVHIVFQDPFSSLNPRMTIRDIVLEPLRQHGVGQRKERENMANAMIEKCGLDSELGDRYPHELSGGQRQRVALARALVLEPSLVIADESVSALDVSVQASILNLLLDLQREMGFSCIFITHDLSVVEFISDRIAVMYLGKIMEEARRSELFTNPSHPYTQALLSAAPVAEPKTVQQRERVILEGDIPSPVGQLKGCPFQSRCPVAIAKCSEVTPDLEGIVSSDHYTACHLVTKEGVPSLV